MCQTFMPGAKLKDHMALHGDYCERGKKNRIPFLPSQVRSQICLYNTFKVQSVGTCQLRNQSRESVIHSERSGGRFKRPGLGSPGSGRDLVGLQFPHLLNKIENVYSAVLGARSEIRV